MKELCDHISHIRGGLYFFLECDVTARRKGLEALYVAREKMKLARDLVTTIPDSPENRELHVLLDMGVREYIPHIGPTDGEHCPEATNEIYPFIYNPVRQFYDTHEPTLLAAFYRLRAASAFDGSPPVIVATDNEPPSRIPAEAIRGVEYEYRDTGLFLRLKAGFVTEHTIPLFQGEWTKQATLLKLLFEGNGSVPMKDVTRALYPKEREQDIRRAKDGIAPKLRPEYIARNIRSVCSEINKRLDADLVSFTSNGDKGIARLATTNIVDIEARKEAHHSIYDFEEYRED